MHFILDTNEKNFPCEICKKPFGRKKSLMTHMKIHTGEKNYVCPGRFKIYFCKYPKTFLLLKYFLHQKDINQRKSFPDVSSINLNFDAILKYLFVFF